MKSLKLNDLGKNYLVENCQKISIVTFTREAKRKVKESFLFSEIEVAGITVGLTTSKTHMGGIRYWFKCPCGKRVGVLFVHPVSQILGCRACLGLEYRKRRFKGMVESNLPK
jgi:hypothetical protein